MSCKCSTFDPDDGNVCSVSGDRCMFFIPDDLACAIKYGEGPLGDKSKEELDAMLVKRKETLDNDDSSDLSEEDDTSNHDTDYYDDGSE